jgi:hypothetical protein
MTEFRPPGRQFCGRERTLRRLHSRLAVNANNRSGLASAAAIVFETHNVIHVLDYYRFLSEIRVTEGPWPNIREVTSKTTSER